MAPLQRAQAPAQTQTLRHFTHQQHPLFQTYIGTEYLCDGCNTLGFGSRYHCPTCNFDLHEHCAKCPFTFHSHFHPHHQLTLINRAGHGHFCDLCGDPVHGMFYTCTACEFDVHPLCTQLPFNVQHPLHRHHNLTLQPGKHRGCAVCGGLCTSWRYRCDTCNFDVHLECVLAASDSVSNCGGTIGQSPMAPWVPPPSPSGGCALGVPASGNWMNVNMNMNQPVNQLMQGQGQASKVQNGSSRRKKIYSVVAKIAVQALVTSVIGVPIGLRKT